MTKREKGSTILSMKKRYQRIVELIEKRQKSNRGKWYWHVKAGNGKILFGSETFNTKYHCKRQAVEECRIYNKAKVKGVYREING